MEAKELCNISISPLVTSSFAIQWSADDHVSLVTDNGVHILGLSPLPTSISPGLQFVRSFVYPSDLLPAAAFAEDLNSLIWGLQREDLYTLLLDEAITPNMENAKDISPKIINVAWSPAKLMQPDRCLLATLNSAGSVEVLFKSSNQWFSACDLSKIWFKEIYGESEIKLGDGVATGPVSNLRNHLRRVQATAITWSPLQESSEGPFAYLITAYRNCEIVIWHVPEISYFKRHELTVSLVFRKHTNKLETRPKINVLKWISLQQRVLLVVGYVDGRVDAILLDIVDKKFVTRATHKYWSESDRISVNCVDIWPNSGSSTKLIICKGFYLITIEISPDGETKETQFVQVDGFFITGLARLGASDMIISTQNGSLFRVSSNNNQLAYHPIKHNLPSSRVQYLGVLCSTNLAFFMCVTSPSIMYDHLITREPSTVYAFKIEGTERNVHNILKLNESKSLGRYWDCFESLRLQLLKIPDLISTLPSIPQDLDALSDYELRLVMWTSVIADTCEKKKYHRRTAISAAEATDVYSLIILRLSSQRLLRLASKKTLSRDQRLSVGLLRSYIEVYLAGEEEEEQTKSIRDAKSALKETDHLSSIQPESCDLCNEIITDLSWKSTTCPLGHKIPRCVITLLQVSAINYRTCPICSQIFHPSLDQETEQLFCPFCDVAALYDNRLVDSRDESDVTLKNCSVRPDRNSGTLVQSKTQDDQKTGSSIKGRLGRKQSTAVIIDNAEDEHYSVTETWEEF